MSQFWALTQRNKWLFCHSISRFLSLFRCLYCSQFKLLSISHSVAKNIHSLTWVVLPQFFESFASSHLTTGYMPLHSLSFVLGLKRNYFLFQQFLVLPLFSHKQVHLKKKKNLILALFSSVLVSADLFKHCPYNSWMFRSLPSKHFVLLFQSVIL